MDSDLSTVRLTDLEFRYQEGAFRLCVPTLQVEATETVAVIGPSGTGKTTLLNLIAGISVPDRGSIRVADTEISGLNDAERRAFRIRKIGLVFQEFELISYLDILDNVLLPYRIDPELKLDSAVRDRAALLIEELGLADKSKRRVTHLSQGERQRVAIARALITNPKLVLADEPTGNLDPRNKEKILDLLFERALAAGVTLMAVTHDHGLLERFDRVVDFDSLAVSS